LLLGFLRFLTVEQWRRIDEDFKPGPPAIDARTALVLVYTAAVLIALRYFGMTGWIMQVHAASDLFGTWPYPFLWPRVYWSACRLLLYFVVPALVIRLLLKERLADYGLRIDRDRRVLALYAAMFLVVFPLVYVASFGRAFQQQYPFYPHAGRSWPELLLWEGSYGLTFFALEFFFRGYLLFTLARRFGSLAIFVMMVPYVMIHFQKPFPETCGAVIAGTALGTLALRTRSIWGGVLIHTAVAWSMDLFALYQKGALLAP